MRIDFCGAGTQAHSGQVAARLEKGEHKMITKGIKPFLIFLFLVSFPAALFAVPSGKVVTWEGGGKAK